MTVSVEMAGPTDLVGAFFIPQRMPYWYGRDMESRVQVQRGAREFAEGLQVRIQGKLANRDVSLIARVTAYERGRLLEWRFEDSYGVTGLQRWVIEAAGSGARVTVRDEFELPGWFGKIWGRLFTRPAVRARDRRDLEFLKRFVERTGLEGMRL
ncbi:MAG TPA: SRPBCC family protein [Candidatus Dormibacteraeota bacterium]|nr:SRPBCC family protein [Candidatus Dormibacteraeota bacterium]